MIRYYERVSDNLVAQIPKGSRAFCKILSGRLVLGTSSKHRHARALTWRQFWRIKTRRKYRD